jgi:hypothetical protein
MRARQLLALVLVGLTGCNSVPPAHPKKAGNSVRYRLLLRDNPVSPTDAAHCYAECQPAATPKRYIECLEECPGFERTEGEYCSNTEVPPVAACITVREIPAKSEPPPGLIVIAVIGEIALAVAAVSLCNSSSTQCAQQSFPPPK